MERDAFTSALRTALMQLDDLRALRENPLLYYFAIRNTVNTPVALQQLLLDAIKTLRTNATLPQTEAYDVLYYRFVEQLTQRDVAFQLGVSVRQLRRYQTNAVEYLAEQLWRAYDDKAPTQEARAWDETREQMSRTPDAFRREIASLRRGVHGEVGRVDRELQKALDEVAVLIEHYEVAVEVRVENVPPAATPSALLRQTLLTVLTAMMPHTSRGALTIDVELDPDINQIVMDLHPENPNSNAAEMWQALQPAHMLLQSFQGALYVNEPRQIRLTIPAAQGALVLVVDDNRDVRYLFRRYAENSRFHIIDTGNSNEVVRLAQRFHISAIILDIMMPDIDGWELLAQLRHHPSTESIPIVVSTILPQRDLSYHLGVSAFIQKPVTRTTFLSTLEHVLGDP